MSRQLANGSDGVGPLLQVLVATIVVHFAVVDFHENTGAEILNPLPYLCDDEKCYGSINGKPIYYDDDHMSESGNKLLVPMFSSVFDDLDNIYLAKKK